MYLLVHDITIISYYELLESINTYQAFVLLSKDLIIGGTTNKNEMAVLGRLIVTNFKNHLYKILVDIPNIRFTKFQM